MKNDAKMNKQEDHPDSTHMETVKCFDQFRAIMDGLPSLVYVADFETHELLFLNKYGRDNWGDSVGEKCWSVLQSGQTGPCEFCRNDKLTDSEGNPKEMHIWECKNTVNNQWYECRDQAIRWSDNRFVRLEIANNITDRKLTEETLREREAYLSAFFNNSAIGISVEDSAGKYKKVNHHYVEMFGYENEAELFEFTVGMLTHPDDRMDTATALKQLANGETDFYRTEKRYIRKDGSVFWGEVSVSPVKDHNGEINTFIAVINDINERKKAEQALKDSENRMRSILEAIPDQVCIIDDTGKIVDYHSTGEIELLTSEEKIIGANIMDVIGAKQAERAMKIVGKIFKTGGVQSFEYNVKFSDGSTRYRDVRIAKYSEKSVIVVVRDITERTNAVNEQIYLKEKLFEMQKTESIVRVAGGIAHEFNNILMGIMGYADLLKLSININSAPEKEAVEVILKEAGRAASLTKQMLSYARGGKYFPVPMNINDVLRKAARMAEKNFDNNIDISFGFENDILSITADINQMELVITNLLQNAVDFMPSGGEILIETKNVMLDDQCNNKPLVLKGGQYIKFSISDNGRGIPESFHGKIFDPFYTTKKVGEGTGLGLASVQGIIDYHKGMIEVSSFSGSGSTFTVYMPASNEKAREIEHVDTNEKITGKGETILVVDDDENIRKLANVQLQSLGYKVLMVSDGIEAVKIYQERKDMIDMIMLDVIMPKMDGLSTFIELSKINPDVKVIVMSGFSKEGKAENIIDRGALGFLQKPFRISEISKLLNSIMKTNNL
jgi:two-component system, cell cycle sensor histidine kinase and response regulator CckA